MNTAPGSFPTLCKQWRHRRHLSQLQLAEAAAISQRHLSWLETGRSQPSSDMILKLADALEVPLRERNTLLHAAGFAARYRESGLEESHMGPIKNALATILEHHMPFPAIVVDRKWNRVMANAAADKLFSLIGAAQKPAESFNLAAATLAPDGLRRFIRNEETVLPLFIQRLRGEALASGETGMIAHVEALVRGVGELPVSAPTPEPLLPVMPLELDINGLELSLFTVMSTFGTPQDITTDELRIEAFYPANDATGVFFKSAGQ
ncbi:MAG: helix-turn-helix transcriptional regulator [Congregibacter sp.]|nr:helix-turn-helix transcriptional regulator [Congregibacter sp.]MDP5069836.1 helix-turn-helix transcriptional regulator [Congregibacter sp.]